MNRENIPKYLSPKDEYFTKYSTDVVYFMTKTELFPVCDCL